MRFLGNIKLEQFFWWFLDIAEFDNSFFAAFAKPGS
jgi:hypothetical protein